MKQTLQLKLSQHLTLTPQLQQSIRLLQLSTVELNAEVERMAREQYGFVYPGEKPYVVVPPSTTSPPAPTSSAPATTRPAPKR